MNRFLASIVFLLTATGAALADTPEYGTDRPGRDYTNFEAQGDFHDCEAACGTDGRCVAWTFVHPGVQGASARCWLKDAVPAPVGGADFAISGVKSGSGQEHPPVPPPPVCEHGDPCASQ